MVQGIFLGLGPVLAWDLYGFATWLADCRITQ